MRILCHHLLRCAVMNFDCSQCLLILPDDIHSFCLILGWALDIYLVGFSYRIDVLLESIEFFFLVPQIFCSDLFKVAFISFFFFKFQFRTDTSKLIRFTFNELYCFCLSNKNETIACWFGCYVPLFYLYFSFLNFIKL